MQNNTKIPLLIVAVILVILSVVTPGVVETGRAIQASWCEKDQAYYEWQAKYFSPGCYKFEDCKYYKSGTSTECGCSSRIKTTLTQEQCAAMTEEASVGLLKPINKFDITKIEIPRQVQQTKSFQVILQIKNTEAEPGKMKVECGLYKKATVDDWYSYGMSALAMSGCDPKNPNVAAKEVYLLGNEEGQVVFDLVAPSTPTNDKYTIHCNAFEYCWEANMEGTHQTYQSSYETKEIELIGGSADSSCSDGIQNRDESDTDCGGQSCSKCGAFMYCSSDYDCESNKCMDNKFCSQTTEQQVNMTKFDTYTADAKDWWNKRTSDQRILLSLGIGFIVLLLFVFSGEEKK